MKYYNYRMRPEPKEALIFCCDNPDSSRYYGDIQRVLQATEKTDTDHIEVIKHAMTYYDVDEEMAESLINPCDIVNSGEAWDDMDFVSWLWDNTGYFFDHDGIITCNGAVFFELTPENLVETNYL